VFCVPYGYGRVQVTYALPVCSLLQLAPADCVDATVLSRRVVAQASDVHAFQVAKRLAYISSSIWVAGQHCASESRPVGARSTAAHCAHADAVCISIGADAICLLARLRFFWAETTCHIMGWDLPLGAIGHRSTADTLYDVNLKIPQEIRVINPAPLDIRVQRMYIYSYTAAGCFAHVLHF
jgi:hypothetical protein